MPCYGGGGRGVKRSDNGFGGSFNSSGADNGVGKFNGVGTKKIKDGEGYGSCERRTEFGNTMLSSFIEQQKAGLRLMQRADNMEKIEDNEGSKRAHKIANKMTDKMTQIDDIGAKIGKIRGVKRRIRVFRAPPPPPVTPMMGKTQ